MFRLRTRYEGSNTINYLKKLKEFRIERILRKYGEEGVIALAHATPKDSGRTSELWGYEIVQEDGRWSIHWTNDNINDGVNIAVILQYGHGTGTGGYVQGIDYVNPAIAPIFDKIADDAWKEVTS